MITHEIRKARYPIKKTLLFDFVLPLLLVFGLAYYLDRTFAKPILQYIVDFPWIGIHLYRSPFFPWYVHYRFFLFLGPLLFFVCGISYRTARIPGPGRAFRRFWQGLLHRTPAPDLPSEIFPPLFNRQNEKFRQLISKWEKGHPQDRLLGYYKRFQSDVESDLRLGRKAEKTLDYFPIVLREEQRYRHMQVVGNTGSGKSYSLLAPMLFQDAASPSLATVTINPKADLYLLKVLATGARRAQGQIPTALLSFHRKESLAYDPLLFGDADSLTKKILNSSDINHPHYRAFQESWLMNFFRIMRTEPEINGTLMLKEIYRYLKRPKDLLADLRDRCKNPDNLAHLHDLADTKPESLSGLSAHVGCLVLDESLTHIFDNPKGRTLNVREVIGKGGNIYLDLDAASKGPQARALGRMIVMELQLLAGARQAGKEKSTVGVQGYLDEFGSFAYNGFIDLLDKCRSSRIGFLLAHQSLGNLQRDNLSPSFKDELVDNTYQKFFLGLSDETAAWASRQMGARKVIRKSLAIGQMTDKTHIHGRDNQTVTFREELEPYVLPSDFALSKGYGFGIVENSQGQVIKAAFRFGYVDPSELCSDLELQDFLERALLDHPKRQDDPVPPSDAPPMGPGVDPEGPRSGEPTNPPATPKMKKPRGKDGDDLDQLINQK